MRYERVTDLESLATIAPLLHEGFLAMNKKRKVFEVDWAGFMQTLVGVVNTTPKNGILVVFDGATPIGYGVGFDDTPAFALQKELLLWALYVKPEYRGDVVVELFSKAKQWAKEQGYQVMKAYNARFTGGMYRLFEGKLGMHRHRVQFNISL